MTPPKPLLTKQECDEIVRAHPLVSPDMLLAAAALGARKTLEMVRDYHRKGGEIHETWLHKRIRDVGGEP